MLTVYGIPNCDTVKKARDWLAYNGVEYSFHDYKKLGIDEAHLKAWCAKLGWENVLNWKSATFKALPDSEKHNINQEDAIALMLEHTSMIKRPIFERGDVLIAGFKADSPELQGLLA